MQILSESEIVHHIRRRKTFSAVLESGAFSIKIDRFVPMVCTAIHAGSRLDPQLEKKIYLSRNERRYEEDPYTDEMIASFPVTLQGLDSRYRYDLNRAPDQCIYKEAWNKKVWKKELSRAERDESLERHASYYRVLGTLLTELQKQFGQCIIYDVHTYNYKRREEDCPLFNIGTHFVDKNRYEPVLAHFKKYLHEIDLPNIDTRIGFDEVFQGKEQQASFVHHEHPGNMLMHLEIKKVYMDELSGELYPLILEELIKSLKRAISYNGAYFTRKYTGKKLHRSRFTAAESGNIVKRVDEALFRVGKGIDTLLYLNPTNLVQEKTRFFARGCNYNPQFVYRQLDIDPYVFRKQLYRVDVDDINDVSIRQMYRSTVDMLATKIDLLTTIGTEAFLYNSLKYYGEPREADVRLARFLIAAPSVDGKKSSELSAEACATAFRRAAREFKLNCRVELSDRIVARVMVNNARKTLLINRRARFSQVEVEAFINHELGVHMVTTLNADRQPLRIFKLGLPGNTESQEGLAVLAEHMSGNLTLARIKILAYRVITVRMMLQDYDFCRTFKVLTQDHGLSRDAAFNLTARVYRGGGFTKDYLYLSGLQKVLKLYQSGVSVEPLCLGKVSIAYLDTIKEMITTGVADKPHYLPFAWQAAVETDPILDYLLSAVA
jgi:uncharacterized protein (TIGR02421 family)